MFVIKFRWIYTSVKENGDAYAQSDFTQISESMFLFWILDLPSFVWIPGSTMSMLCVDPDPGMPLFDTFKEPVLLSFLLNWTSYSADLKQNNMA
jgi:hypothetical protein